MKKKITHDGSEKLREQLARALADYDNLKKRVEREQEDWEERAKMRIVARLLPAFDMFDQVQKHVKDSGLAMAMAELDNLLGEEGFEPIEPRVGEMFDEKKMEAVEVAERGKGKEGAVAEVILKGWKMDGEILRYAKVVVLRGKSEHE